MEVLEPISEAPESRDEVERVLLGVARHFGLVEDDGSGATVSNEYYTETKEGHLFIYRPQWFGCGFPRGKIHIKIKR